MTVLLLLEHVIAFIGPAVGLAFVLVAGFEGPPGSGSVRWSSSDLLLAFVGVVVLLAGLVVFGRDGRMLTYAALVLSKARWPGGCAARR
jgi:hypothetical protein